jgi:hypothetical protein
MCVYCHIHSHRTICSPLYFTAALQVTPHTLSQTTLHYITTFYCTLHYPLLDHTSHTILSFVKPTLLRIILPTTRLYGTLHHTLSPYTLSHHTLPHHTLSHHTLPHTTSPTITRHSPHFRQAAPLAMQCT